MTTRHRAECLGACGSSRSARAGAARRSDRNIAGGFIVARLLARAFYGVAPADPRSFGATAVLQVLVTLIASALPAYRATRADPMTALRHD